MSKIYMDSNDITQAKKILKASSIKYSDTDKDDTLSIEPDNVETALELLYKTDIEAAVDIEFYSDEHVNNLQEYIENNFTLDRTSRQLVRTILDYIAAQAEDADITKELILELLSPIGIKLSDILKGIEK